MITGKKHLVCGLIGKKLSHSFSPQIHSELADYSYSLFELAEDELGGFLTSRNFDALNVTIPYKKAVIPYLDEISDEALRIGAVNTVVKAENGALRGDNTDYYGLFHTLKSSGIKTQGKSVLILGTGGASLTAKCVCEDLGAKKISFLSRTGEINYENVYDVCRDTEVVINCTPVGMYPHNGASPIELKRLPLCRGVVDLIYNPAKTKLLLEAEELGIPAANGLYMLVAQAKRASELFLGEAIPDGEIDRVRELIAKKTENIILVGMPGCGKTTVSLALAEMTSREVVDTDQMISEKHGRTPAEIINADGEEDFRIIETEILAEAGKMSGVIISTGGGVVTRKVNRDLLRQNGKVVFIKRPLDALATSDRPLSKNLESLYAHRLPLYRDFADVEVDNITTPENCAEEILELLK